MNGTKLLLDTNILIYLLQENDPVIHSIIAEIDVGISIKTKIEILGYHKITKEINTQINTFIVDSFHVVPLNDSISEKAIELRKKYNLKTPDSIIAATAQRMKIPLVTEDKKLHKIEELEIYKY